MKKWLVSVSVSVVLAMSALSAQAAGDADAGKAKAAACAACHGPDGNSANPIWPKLAGQHPAYLQKQIMDFKSGARKDPLMSAQAAALTEEDASNLAAFFASQNQKGGSADPAVVAMGMALYRSGKPANGVVACSGCHGPVGMGNSLARFPRISGQHADYVAKALKDFRTGARANDPNGMMGGVAAHMSDQEIAAVAQYVQGLTE